LAYVGLYFTSTESSRARRKEPSQFTAEPQLQSCGSIVFARWRAVHSTNDTIRTWTQKLSDQLNLAD